MNKENKMTRRITLNPRIGNQSTLDWNNNWISEYIKNPKCTNNFNKGVKKTYWEDFMKDNAV